MNTNTHTMSMIPVSASLSFVGDPLYVSIHSIRTLNLSLFFSYKIFWLLGDLLREERDRVLKREGGITIEWFVIWSVHPVKHGVICRLHQHP